MRRRVLLLACALGAVSVIGFAPQAQASCHQYTIGEFQTDCIENVVCGLVSRVHQVNCVD
jgi:hypothetical protein